MRVYARSVVERSGAQLNSILERILTHKRAEVEEAKRAQPIEALRALAEQRALSRDFFGAVTAPSRKPNLIAEVKKASPSAGVIRSDFDPVAVAHAYAEGGAAALSVLTDERFFGGRLDYIDRIKRRVGLPVLRKDFLIEPYQVYESGAHGADAVLLIAEAFEVQSPGGKKKLEEMARVAGELELTVLLEVHDAESLREVLSAGIFGVSRRMLLGINNRDLRTQAVDVGHTERLAELVPAWLPMVSESGVRTAEDVERLARAGARALLVGESLMRSEDVAAAIRALFARE